MEDLQYHWDRDKAVRPGVVCQHKLECLVFTVRKVAIGIKYCTLNTRSVSFRAMCCVERTGLSEGRKVERPGVSVQMLRSADNKGTILPCKGLYANSSECV